jgi:hypothetical protein
MSSSASASPATPAGPIVVIVMENHSYSQIMGDPCCPYLNAQASAGRIYANYHAVAHPSLPNYLAMSSGSTCGKVGTDAVVPFCRARNLWDQLRTAGVDWRVYQESMPAPCSLTNTSHYFLRHNPEAIFADQAHSETCRENDLPLPATIDTLPPLTFVTPNICNDMHSCSAATGDAWLQEWLPRFLAVSGTRVVVTFDEGEGDNHILAFEVGAGVPNAVNRTNYSHYSLLAGIEDAFGRNRLGNAAHAIRLPI